MEFGRDGFGRIFIVERDAIVDNLAPIDILCVNFCASFVGFIFCAFRVVADLTVAAIGVVAAFAAAVDFRDAHFAVAAVFIGFASDADFIFGADGFCRIGAIFGGQASDASFCGCIADTRSCVVAIVVGGAAAFWRGVFFACIFDVAGAIVFAKGVSAIYPSFRIVEFDAGDGLSFFANFVAANDSVAANGADFA